ncbi:TadE/TadG family type IV pilus assembly protein [Octadecabacter sp. R77987]|uniref:TadE/TadG family type IV pilus assembly protein n=1 Tax=Octadecabacter sp. R77987 TaxID=3093874 RepID=UPI003670216C
MERETFCDRHIDNAPGFSGLKDFKRDEDGGMIIFALFIFVLMLMAGGMAIDFMRFETTRTKLQGTLDRAVLAAADMEQPLPPAEVVADYFAKAGMSAYLVGEPVVHEGLNYRRVSARAEASMAMMFADMMNVFTDPFSPGVRAITTPASGTAEERVTNVEVSLVLDISSSMNSNGRFGNMQDAAEEFVDLIMANNGLPAEGLISMSIIAYSSVVNLGEEVASHYNVDTLHEYSNCLLLPDEVFDYPGLPMDGYGFAQTPYTQVSHFEQWYDWSYGETLRDPICFAGEQNAVIVHSTSPGDLNDMVDDLYAYGNTAIDLGMKWATAFLDPSSRDLVTDLITAGDAPAVVAGRPMDYGLSDNLKVIVLMTDGQNTTEYDIAEPYKSGMSPIWFDRDGAWEHIGDVSENDISILVDDDGSPNDFTDDTFFWLDQPYWNRIHDYPQGYPDYKIHGPNGPDGVQLGVGQGVEFPGHVHHASWQDIYAFWSRSRIKNEFMNEPYSRGYISYSEYVGATNADYSVVNGNEADDRLSDICAEARNANIIVYTVAFEAPYGGQVALQDCASSPSHYFTASGTDLAEKFATIASDIRSLKLTQ